MSDGFRIAEGFKVERIHDVSGAGQGSWVCLTADPKGRLYASDQDGALYRVTPPPIGKAALGAKVEKIALPVGQAQGLCWAADSLYVVVATNTFAGQGLYRVRDTDGDDRLDHVRLLKALGKRRSEHGPHAVIPAPDGRSLCVIAGNHTEPVEMDRSRVPPGWGEEDLLPRLPANLGSEVGTPAPGGWIARTTLDGDRWEWMAMGLRNAYDLAFNRDGELFTFDADAEYDLNTPWYRPTRVYHVVSGAEFGWRNGAGKFSETHADAVPPVLDMGPGSPTGISFGTGAKFPPAYQEALFACDWSYGRLYVVHLEPWGGTYRGRKELFLKGSPMPITDLAVNPRDGAMYFATGGRRTRSALYRITYVGGASTAPARPSPKGRQARALRRRLEAYHGRTDGAAVDACWPYLAHPDRSIRYAARLALEHQPATGWQERALAETERQASLSALLALGRSGEASVRPGLLDALGRHEWSRLLPLQRFDYLRTYQQAFHRMGKPEAGRAGAIARRLGAVYPATDRRLNAELCKLLVFLEAPGTAEKTIALLRSAPTQEERLEYLKSLRHLKTGWTRAAREEYFKTLVNAGGYTGGRSLLRFVDRIRDDAEENLSDEERTALEPILDASPPREALVQRSRPLAGRKKVREWTVADLAPKAERGMTGRDLARGKGLFGAAGCFACHRFRNQGGAVGPDLSGAGGRFGVRDLLEAILEPSKAINDQFAAVEVLQKDGKRVRGQIINNVRDRIILSLDLYDPSMQVRIERANIDKIEPSKVSMMPTGLLDPLREDEILDLLAYVISGGDPDHPAFRKP